MPAFLLEDVMRTTHEVVDEVVAPLAERIDREGHWPEESIRALQRSGLGGLVVPEADGGLGHGLAAVARVCETIGRACATSAITFGIHCVGTAVIAARPTEQQRARFLQPIARGEHLTSLALSEPGTGSHFYIPEALLRSHGDGYVLSGEKSFVTNGSHADSYVVSAAAAPDDGPAHSFSCVIVPADTPGLTWGPAWTGLGMRGNDSRNLTLQDAPLDAGLLLGRVGDEMWYVLNVIAPYFLTAMAATYLGVAAAAFDELRAHLLSRRHAHSGTTLSENQVIQHRVGTLWATTERSRRLLYHAAALGDAGASDAPLSLFAAKAEIADAAVHVVNEAMTLMGGAAYTTGATMQRRLRDVRAPHVISPPTDLLRVWTGRWLLDAPLFSD